MQHEPLGMAMSRAIIEVMGTFPDHAEKTFKIKVNSGYSYTLQTRVESSCNIRKIPEMSYLIERIIQLDPHAAYRIAKKAMKYDGYKKDAPHLPYKEELFNYTVVLASLVTPLRMGLISDMFLPHVVVTLTTEFTPLDPCFSDYILILAKDYDSINLWLKTLDLEDLES